MTSGVETHRFKVASTRLGTAFDVARNGNNEEAQNAQIVRVME